jgi:DNA polymerase elongation subunit (family B)
LFLAEFRDVFLVQVPDDSQKDKEKKRKALEKIARLQFKREPDNVQRIYINKARQPESPVPLADGQDPESRSSGDCLQSTGVLAVVLALPLPSCTVRCRKNMRTMSHQQHLW